MIHSKRFVTAAEMKEIDERAVIECGIPAALLMENAGAAVAGEARKIAGKGSALVICGYGNNGGDGLVAARHLNKRGHDTRVFLAGPPKKFSAETQANFDSLLKTGARVNRITGAEDIQKAFAGIENPGVVIDAVFGIGLKGALDDFYVQLIDKINAVGAPVVAADIPSGLDADTGEPLPAAVKAARTVTFALPKAGFKNPASRAYTGEIIIADIGFPKELLR